MLREEDEFEIEYNIPLRVDIIQGSATNDLHHIQFWDKLPTTSGGGVKEQLSSLGGFWLLCIALSESELTSLKGQRRLGLRSRRAGARHFLALSPLFLLPCSGGVRGAEGGGRLEHWATLQQRNQV